MIQLISILKYIQVAVLQLQLIHQLKQLQIQQQNIENKK